MEPTHGQLYEENLALLEERDELAMRVRILEAECATSVERGAATAQYVL